MPPFLPRKRLRSASPEAGPSKPPAKAIPKSTPRKPTLFDDLDAGTGSKRTAENHEPMLKKLAETDDESSLSSLSEDEFEDVPNAKRHMTNDESEDEDDDEDVEFEDVDTYAMPGPSGPAPSGDLELTLTKDPRVSISNPMGTKKGPSKIERQIRVATHQMHVQLLMFHNAIRNAWLCDKELQQILVKHLTPGILKEMERWRRDSGLQSKEEGSLKGKSKGKAKATDTKGKKADSRSQRDWAKLAKKFAEGEVNMSAGDPLFRLLRVLISFWKQRFRIIAPGLRKLGYMSLERLDKETKSFENDEHDPERHGERIRCLDEFKACAKSMEGSRDVGAQLFTGLLRGLGLEARLVANLQPVGFGWSQNEEAFEKNPRKLKKKKATEASDHSDDDRDSSDEEKLASDSMKGKAVKDSKSKSVLKSRKSLEKSSTKATRNSLRGNGLKDSPIRLSGSEEQASVSDDESIIDITPVKKGVRPSLPYDKDLRHPSYWTEVLSPVSHTYFPVDSLVINMVAKNDNHFEGFIPQAKSEKLKHITSYVVGHSSDGTAKDVTTRYLKGRIWPGRTKGYRLPIEKIPVHDRRGKIKRYEQYDWFKTVMSGYVRGSKLCPREEVDDHEEATILKPVKREKKVVEEGKETLQYYKTSSEFVLERHLKREEALLPASVPVKMFTVKGKGETSTEEKVFRRKDVVNCKSMETWHKEGRAPKIGQEPLKRVPYRAATTNRRRELAEAELAAGEKVLQGLFSWDQTDWIIPPPIENGIIPKNSFGNIDLYVDSMLPEGAVHIPMRGTKKICNRLGIDFAEAVTGFEFGHRMAVPIITGVVIAEEHYEKMMDEWQKDETERIRKEDEKRRKSALNMWRKLLMGLRIVERVQEEYGDVGGDEVDVLNPFTNKNKGREVDRDAEAQRQIMEQRDEDNAGGFFPEGHHEEDPDERHAPSFFPVAHHDDDDDQGGGFVVENHDEEPAEPAVGQAYATPQSLQFKFSTVTKSHEDEGEDKDEDDGMVSDGQESESGSKPVANAPATKKRGRPLGSTNKSAKAKATPNKSKSKAIAKTPAKRSSTTQSMVKSKTHALKHKAQVQDSDEEELSSLSELESEVEVEDEEEEEEEEPAPKRVKRGGRKSLPAKMDIVGKTAAPTRKTPKRNAARKSETALRSHYFEQSDDDGEDD